MAEIQINSEFISQKYIDQCIEEFHSTIIKEDKPKLILIAQKKIEEIDILLIAYFILFKTTIPKLEITINLKSQFQSDGDSFSWKLRQYMAYSYLATGKSIFQVRYDTNVPLRIQTESPTPFQEKWFVLSEKFLPLIFINADNYNIFFKKSLLKTEEIDSEIKFNESHESLFENIKTYIINKIINTHNDNPILELAKLSFYKALLEAKVLSFYLNFEYRKHESKSINIRSGSIQNAYDFYERIKRIFDELSEKPIIYIFIYSTILSSGLLPSNLNKNSMEAFIDTLFNLWDFTKDLVHGLQELSKNIIEHSSEKTGVVTIRIYKRDKWEELKKENSNVGKILEEFLSDLDVGNESNKLSFLDINVIDLGKRGVIETLLDESRKEGPYNEVTKAIMDEDIKMLENEKVKFEHFIDSNNGIFLNQQAKRATAHLGLLTFSKLVESNGGLMRASTWEKNSEVKRRDNFIVPDKYGKSHLVPYGTNFHIVLPINSGKKYSAHLQRNISTRTELLVSEMQVIEDLLKYEFVSIDQLCEPGNIWLSDNFLIDVTPLEELISTDGSASFWKNFREKAKKINNEVKLRKSIFCFNLNNKLINGGDLFKFLGSWELEFPGFPIIIYNISTESVYELNRINNNYLEKLPVDFPYWNENSFVVLYSFEEMDSMRFYFCDALWGKSKESFIKINWLLKKTNFNAITLLEENQIVGEANLLGHELEELSRFKIFHNKMMLLPFDLLLLVSENTSLFENNAKVLLYNELKLNQQNA